MLARQLFKTFLYQISFKKFNKLAVADTHGRLLPGHNDLSYCVK